MAATALKHSRRLVVASHNAGKVGEIQELLEPYGIFTFSASELGLTEPEETGETFAENAELKALAAAKQANLPALADDSGLEVAALGNAPGIYSARWAGSGKEFSRAMERVARELEEAGALDTTARRAHFTCALALGWPDGGVQTFIGKVFGHIVWPPRGSKGFGYDPIFVPEGRSETFGEMDPDDKHAISHRARAFEAFVKSCFSCGGN
jgi:XTP/dITP diphosphohydrolase